MKALGYNKALRTTDPQILFSQIVYHFSHISVDKDDEWYRVLFMPPLSFLYAGVMQAMGFSAMSPGVRTLVIVSQGEQT